MRTYLSDTILNHEIYLKRKKISDAIVSKTKHFYAASKEGTVNALGHIHRWQTGQKKIIAAFAGFEKFSTYLAFAVSDALANDAIERTREAAKSLRAYFAASTAATPVAAADAVFTPERFSNDFIVSAEAEYINNALNVAIKNQANNQVNDLNLIARGKFMGPLELETLKLANEFKAGDINNDQFTGRALAMRGFIFSDCGQHIAISQEKLKPLRKEFNCEHGGSCAIRTFTKAAQSVSIAPNRAHAMLEPAYIYN